MEVFDYLLGKKAGGGSSPAVLQDKEVEITENGETTVRADSGYDGLSSVEITVSGILDTSDADAVASDMAMGKTAYVDGNKITGNVHIGSPSVSTNYSATDVDIYIDDLQVDTQQGNTNQMFRTGDKISVYTPLSDVAPVVGASAEKIKKDEVICGVTGTYTGSKYAPKWIIFGNSSTTSNAYQGSDLNYEVSNLSLANLDTLNNMFANCRQLISLDLSSWDTSNITAMGNMFYYCTQLTSLNVKDFNTSSVSNFFRTFYSCTQLTSLDLNNWTLTNGAYVGKMFEYCTNLTHLDIRNFDFSNATSYSDMFGTTASTGVPDNCEIIVADATQKQWLNTNFNRLTNVKTVAEYEGN